MQREAIIASPHNINGFHGLLQFGSSMSTVTMDLVATCSKIPTHFFRNPSTPNTGVANRERVPEDSCKFTTPDIRYFLPAASTDNETRRATSRNQVQAVSVTLL